MASGDTLLIFTALHNEAPSGNGATVTIRNSHMLLAFDASSNESAVFRGVMPRSYAGGGVTVYLHWSTTVTTGVVDFDVSFERIGDGQQDIDLDGFASVTSIDGSTVPGTSGHVSIVQSAMGSIDSAAVGESFRLKITRDAVSDTASADVELSAIEIKET